VITAGIAGLCIYSIISGIIKEFVGLATLIIAAASAGVLHIFTFVVIIAVRCRLGVVTLLSHWVLMLLVIVQILICLLVAYWVWSLDGISYDLLAELVGESGTAHASTFISNALATPISVIEGFSCTTYQQCCRPPNMSPGDCSPPHEGSDNDVLVALRDPSSDNFCAYLTGAPRETLIQPPPGVCLLIDGIVPDMDFAACQASFCDSGVDGHVAFVTKIVNVIRRWAGPIGGGFFVLVLLQLIYACNVRSARLYNKRLRKTAPTAKGKYGDAGLINK